MAKPIGFVNTSYLATYSTQGRKKTRPAPLTAAENLVWMEVEEWAAARVQLAVSTPLERMVSEANVATLESLGLVESTPTSIPMAQLLREIVELEDGDLVALVESGPAHSQSSLQHIRAIHHVIALRLSIGERPIDISRALSLTPQTITKLCKDPQFQDLVESYQTKVLEKAVDQVELMGLAAVEATTALHERLCDPEQRGALPIDALLKVALGFADRTGHSPIRRSEVNARHEHTLNTETIERLKALHGEDIVYDRSTVQDAEYAELGEGSEVPNGEETAFSVVDLFESAQKENGDEPSAEGQDLREQGTETAEDGV